MKNVNQTQKELCGYEHILSMEFFQKKKLENKLGILFLVKIRNKGNKKTTFIFWNLKKQENEAWRGWGGGGGGIFKTNIKKEIEKKIF